MHVTAIIAAGGRGTRLGATVPKQLLDLRGKPILRWSTEAFLRSPSIEDLVIVLPPDIAQSPPAYLRVPRVTVVAGGVRRQDSVAHGLEAAPPGTDIVVVHDAARPLVDVETIERVVRAADESGAAIAALSSRDTVKLAGSEDRRAGSFVTRTIPREMVFLAQTPQAFRVDVLRRAVSLGQGGVTATDEAALAEQAGYKVRLVEGNSRNIKITTPEDIVVAEALMKDEGGSAAQNAESREDEAMGARDALGRPGSVVRVGSGYDLHRLAEGRPLVIGGVTIPFEKGLAGHSDADVVCHALIDAILGAMAAGDIGTHFPDTDPRWSGANSLELLGRVSSLSSSRGFALVNADVTLIAERPKIGPYRDSIVSVLACALGLPEEAVSVKAKTNEGVDAVGRGEAMAAHAVVLLERAEHT